MASFIPVQCPQAGIQRSPCRLNLTGCPNVKHEKKPAINKAIETFVCLSPYRGLVADCEVKESCSCHSESNFTDRLNKGRDYAAWSHMFWFSFHFTDSITWGNSMSHQLPWHLYYIYLKIWEKISLIKICNKQKNLFFGRSKSYVITCLKNSFSSVWRSHLA